ncbi:MAG: LysR family transcriptional regulator [Deltaproteobacteria bacterium]|nr:LysR family transcriptional regulator [Deltaproteobacteria bacterium]
MAIDQLRRMGIFGTVVELRGFSEAARKLGLTRSAVSRQVALLETQLGVRLLHRTTRTLRLTEAGAGYYEACARILAEARAADESVRQLQSRPTGTLRVTGPVIGHRLIVPPLLAFMARYPEVKVDVLLDDHYLNLVEEGIDVGIRIGLTADVSLVARKVAPIRYVVCATPGYLKRRGTPKEPQDLAGHDWLIYSLLPSPRRLVFHRDGRRVTVRVNGRFTTNGGLAGWEALMAGAGITAMPSFYLADELRARRLRPLLEEYELKPSALYLVYPHREHLPTKVRLFVDFYAQQVATLLPAT